MQCVSKRVCHVFSTLVVLLAFGSLLACGGAAASSPQSTSSTSALAISPSSVAVQIGTSQQFTAAVQGVTSNAVTWMVNNVNGGNSSVGTISSSGLYTAPSTPPSTPVDVSAQSPNRSESATAVVTVLSTPNNIAVSVSPKAAVLQVGLTQQFTATVTGISNQSVTWLVNGVVGGNSSVGTINSSGFYKAPQVAPSAPVNVTARSVVDSTKSASAAVTVGANPGSVSVVLSPNNISLAGSQTQQFTATVSGTSNKAVNWLVNNIPGGSASVGTITSSGIYQAPLCPTSGKQTITAVSQYDTKASASVSVNVSSGPSNGVYYVSNSGSDTNDGSACHPWATINHADKMVRPGMTVHVSPGTYKTTLSTSASGTASAPIKYISDVQWGAKIVGDYTGATPDFVWFGTGNYVDIEGFEITAATNLPRFGIRVTGTNNRILNNKVHDIVAINGGNLGGAGIEVDLGSNYSEISYNYIYNIGVGTGNSLHVHGIYLAASKYNYVSNNLVINAVGWGIQQYHYPISNSTIVNNTILNSGGGIIIGTDGTGSNVTDYNYVANNITDYTNYIGGYGIRECCDPSNVGTHNTYTNNLVFNNTPADFFFYNSDHAVNSVTADPQFVNYTGDQYGDYHLLSSSPAKDAGTSSNVPKLDFLGGSRPAGAGWDIGAYEYGANPGVYPWF